MIGVNNRNQLERESKTSRFPHVAVFSAFICRLLCLAVTQAGPRPNAGNLNVVLDPDDDLFELCETNKAAEIGWPV